ncbi:type IV secretory system conjugative DNA transfer family protein [Aureimonas sp. N4]|uniref:type IV secretory system conjugative DNA transfer family protein n=1 Tax=Aureimonas sp. N4 TaxID=1638165 RepID=UPI000B06B508|nr:type IV secretory system conjugative DNA transfer family protein [Aureimonas sp. N4]
MTRIESLSPGIKALVYGLIGLAAVALFVAIASGLMQIGLREWDRAYNPIMMPQYLWLYPSDEVVKSWAYRGGLGAVIICLFGFGAIIRRRPNVHGSARFAKESEICRPISGGDSLRETVGILVGEKNGRFLCLGGSEHVMLYAPTRSGKGVSCAIPNLLNWPDSAVVLDVKQENFAKTAGFRARHGQEVYLFDPLDQEGRTARYNPLGHIDRESPIERLDELQKIASMLFPDPPKADPIWAQMARTGFIGVGSMVAETPDRPFTIGEIYRQLTIGDTKTYLRETIESRREAGSPFSERTTLAVNDFTAAPDNMFGSTKNTITSSLALWLNPAVDRATSVSDFDLRDLRERRITVYLGVSPDNMERVRPLYALFFQQMIDLNTRQEAHQYKVLLVLDEFARLGQASVLASAFSYVASYGIRLLPILQSPSQLSACYGSDVADEIMTNCGVEIIFTPKELKIAQNISERIGYAGIETRSVSRPTLFSAGRRTQTEGEQRRALMMPQELLQMPRHELLVMRGGVPPVRGRKITYYTHRGFKSRLFPPPASPALGPIAQLEDPRDQKLRAQTAENARLRAQLEQMADELDASRVAAKRPSPTETLTEASQAGHIVKVMGPDDDEVPAAPGIMERNMTDAERAGEVPLDFESLTPNFQFAHMDVSSFEKSAQNENLEHEISAAIKAHLNSPKVKTKGKSDASRAA